MAFLEWLEYSSLAIWVAESLWAYPVLLTLHSVGLSVVVGIITIVNLRVLGCFSKLEFAPLAKLINILWAGFLLNFASGFLLFSGQATYFITHKAFLIKIFAIFFALLNAILIQRILARTTQTSSQDSAMEPKTKLLAAGSILIWLTAITAGRLIAYI